MMCPNYILLHLKFHNNLAPMLKFSWTLLALQISRFVVAKVYGVGGTVSNAGIYMSTLISTSANYINWPWNL